MLTDITSTPRDSTMPNNLNTDV